MTATVHWAAELTALSSIVHAGDTRGTATLLRRETIATPDGLELIPLISGNALRGRLRRIGEELLRDTLNLEAALPLTAAYALRNGGSLHKSAGEPLSGRRRAEIRALIPQIGVFGCAASGTIIDGCLQVGKAVPHVTETRHLTGVTSNVSAFELVQLEEYSHTDDLHDHAAPATVGARAANTGDPACTTDNYPGNDSRGAPGGGSNQMRYAVETFPAGTRFSTHFRLDRATDLQIAFFTDILSVFAATGRLGGRLGTGHGLISLDTQAEIVAGWYEPVDWPTHLHDRREHVLDALRELR